MTAIKAHKDRIAGIEKEMEACLKDGCVLDQFRYKYQLLYRRKEELKESLNWMLNSTIYKNK